MEINNYPKRNKLPPGLESGFVGIPRKLLEELRGGLLTINEFHFLVYMYLSCDQLGKCYLNTRMVAEDLLKNESRYDYAGKIIRALKTKGYINFDERQGEKSNFQVRVDRFLMSNGNFTDLKMMKPNSEVSNKIPKFVPEENPESSGKKEPDTNVEFRSENNKNENENEKRKEAMKRLRDSLIEKKIIKE